MMKYNGPIKINATVLWLLGCLLMFPMILSTSVAFMTSTEITAHIRHNDTSLWGGGLFGSKRKENKNSEPQPLETLQLKDILSITPPIRVLEIPVSSIKRGGLRFALGLHLIGMEQEKGTWRPNQTSEDALVMEFKDNSTMFQVTFDDDAIRVDRYGRPSLQYLLQESLVLHSVLDELNILCFDGGIMPGNRLIQLKEPGDAIEIGRAVLPARNA